MFRKLLKTESGYSLVEVMVSIVLLTIAIIPMVGMFDVGLDSATEASDYDKARALANLKMEQAKSLPFATVRDDFPVTGSAPVGGSYDSGYISVTGPGSADFPDPPFQYRVEKQYMAQPVKTPSSSSLSFGTCATDSTCGGTTDPIRITVTVKWTGARRTPRSGS